MFKGFHCHMDQTIAEKILKMCIKFHWRTKEGRTSKPKPVLCTFGFRITFFQEMEMDKNRYEHSSRASNRTKQFSYIELKIATNGFHSNRIIGHVASGFVYKVFRASSGNATAVKRLKYSQEGMTKSQFG